MTIPGEITVTLPADVNQVDDTGYVWAFLSDGAEPGRVRPGAIIVAGDPVEAVSILPARRYTAPFICGCGRV